MSNRDGAFLRGLEARMADTEQARREEDCRRVYGQGATIYAPGELVCTPNGIPTPIEKACGAEDEVCVGTEVRQEKCLLPAGHGVVHEAMDGVQWRDAGGLRVFAEPTRLAIGRLLAGPNCESAAPAVKADDGKPACDLLPPAALLAVAEVLSHGAAKYGRHNWRFAGGLAWSRLVAALLRHLLAWQRGEDKDGDSGLPHLAHAACCALMLCEYQATGGGTDDRWRAA